MPPKTRSGHIEKLEAQELIKSGRANVAGLAAVPVEILVNVFSQFSCIPIPYTGPFHGQFPFRFLERQETLQALARTCSRLRSVVLPILWEKIEVAVRENGGKDRGFEKRLATELVRQLEIVTVRDPTLASRVQEVSIHVSGYSWATVFAELVRALYMFPKMRSLQIFAPSSCVSSGLADAFSGHTFPSVKFLTLTNPSFTLVKSFPQVESYYTSDSLAVFFYWEFIIMHWKAVTVINGLAVPDKDTLALIVAKLPNLSYLEIQTARCPTTIVLLDMVPLLQLLKKLQVVKLIVDQYATGEEYAIAKANVSLALTKLRPISSQKHRIIVEYRRGVDDIPNPVKKLFELGKAGVVVASADQSY